MNITILAQDFLQQKRIAVVGVSSTKKTPANGVYKRLKKLNYEVFAVNPHLEKFENDKCYPGIKSIPSLIDGVFIVTRPANTERVVEQCVELKIPRVWMHCSSGIKHKQAMESNPNASTSVSQKAIQLCRENNIAVIPGACPMMFGPTADVGHKCMRWGLLLTGKLHTKEDKNV
ncbi:MAG: CoA-binding protein [Bacteroidota bacterium]|nr:CoA-binding protein [Bacteroidota bacterium]